MAQLGKAMVKRFGGAAGCVLDGDTAAFQNKDAHDGCSSKSGRFRWLVVPARTRWMVIRVGACWLRRRGLLGVAACSAAMRARALAKVSAMLVLAELLY